MFYGTTQIMPREIYIPLAEALAQLVATLDKIATDIRLDARSARTIMQEPFKLTQKGSSAMPGKKNTIISEQAEGMSDMAMGYLHMIAETQKTWQERAIHQSCVERVAWPDLFFVVTHTLKRMTRVLSQLQVYQDEMLQEIMDCRGVYATNRAKGFLARHGFAPEEAYRIVQLAAETPVSAVNKSVRELMFKSYCDATEALIRMAVQKRPEEWVTIEKIIRDGRLKTSPNLAATEEVVEEWNKKLKALFTKPRTNEKWSDLFSFGRNLRGEAVQIDRVLAEAKVLFGK